MKVGEQANLEMEEMVTLECQACLQASKGVLEVSLVPMVFLKRGKDLECLSILQLMTSHSLEDKGIIK
jgi:hypothetical protein